MNEYFLNVMGWRCDVKWWFGTLNLALYFHTILYDGIIIIKAGLLWKDGIIVVDQSKIKSVLKPKNIIILHYSTLRDQY